MHEHYRMLVSAVIDGEATDAERAELAEHIAECPECAALLEAYSAVGAELADEVEPPESLASGVMFRVKNEKKKRRFAFGRFTAIAAAAIVIIFAGRFALSGLFKTGSNAPGSNVPDEAPHTIGDSDVNLDGDGVPRAPEASGVPDDYEPVDDPDVPLAGPGSMTGDTDARTAELMDLALEHPDVEAIYVVSSEAGFDPKGSVANAVSGGVWYERPAEEGKALEEKADNVIYLQDGAETCIIVVYND
ncbi:MAG: zf-HC2 domain-containing protein [Oscillospiraceae bacterium]|nr:zf-HC2 domain-containing protein [Oscillospiraceae bacterium]